MPGIRRGQFAHYSRGHWSVEANLHRQLDVRFNEDQREIRKDNGAENLTQLSRIALNLLKRDHGQSEASRPGEPCVVGTTAMS
jgi:predicted transposase YbfD/YdcC